ncbi:larval cuticle protein 65Ab1-like [Musca autumnalis]|uniref:larval cuticle protein 65Ab1-like n=1 Tax=Musca autumnalis TaxID=221902 RepID=UPI003CF42804
MKFFIVFAALFAVALARPDVEIVKQVSDVGPDAFVFETETSDGAAHNAAGVLNNAGTDHESIAVRGTYTWVDEKTGERFTVNYVADENGFQPEGAHLPVA